MYHRAVALPTVLELADPKPGELLLDIGCGQGVLAPHVLERGARYQGVDGSRTLVQLARKHHGENAGSKAQFIVGDARKLSALPELKAESADVAVFMLSIQDMNPLGEILAAAAWALQASFTYCDFYDAPGRLECRVRAGGGLTQGGKLTYRRVDSYLTSRGVPMKAVRGGVGAGDRHDDEFS